MSNTSFAPTLLLTVRQNITVLLDQYRDATGYTPTFMSQCLMADRAFFNRLMKRGLDVRTYDLFVGRMSGVWPATHRWPEGIPRPEPIALNDAGVKLMAEREAARAAPPPVEDWPADIPQPKQF